MDGHCDLLGWMPGSAPVWLPLPARDKWRMIIDQTDRIDNGHRPHQFEPCRPKPARRPRRAAHRAQRHARRGSCRPQAVGHEPQPRPPARAVRRRTPDPRAGRHAPYPARPRADRPGADRARADHGPGVPGRDVRRPDSRTAVPDRPDGQRGGADRSRAARPRLRGRSRHPVAPSPPSGFSTSSTPTNWTSALASGRFRRDRRTTSGACSAPTRSCACSMPSGSASHRRSRSRTMCGCRMCSRACARASGSSRRGAREARAQAHGRAHNAALRGGAVSRGRRPGRHDHACEARTLLRRQRSGSALARCRSSCRGSHHAGLARLLRSRPSAHVVASNRGARRGRGGAGARIRVKLSAANADSLCNQV